MKFMCLSKTLILASVLLQSALWSTAASADADSARNNGAAWLIKQQRGDGSWSTVGGDLPVQATATAILALKYAGLARSPTYGSATAWLANAEASSVDSISRKIEALTGAGLAAISQSEADRLFALRSLSFSATWGGYGGGGVDTIDTALGLGALRVGDSDYVNKAGNVIATAVCAFGNSRIDVAASKRPWPATLAAPAGQGRPSVVATALVLSELRAMQLRVGYSSVPCSSGPTYSFTTLQAEAQAWLLDQQNPDGGFGEQRTDGSKGTSNIVVTAWVYRALSAQASPPQTQIGNAQAWLLNQQDTATGSWRSDPLVTATVVAALPPALGVHLIDTDRDGITDEVEKKLAGSNTNVADARNQLKPPSLSIPGATAAAFVANARVGQAFTYSLVGTGNFRLVTGTLPPGLSLNTATGQITGTPLQAGSYSFEYTSNGANPVIGGIEVAVGVPIVPPPPPPLVPAWLFPILEMLLDD